MKTDTTISNIDTYAIGQRVKELRKNKNLSQQGLEEALGFKVSYATIKSIESGKNNDIKASTIITLAQFFDVSTDYLLGLEKHKHPVYKQFDADITSISKKTGLTENVIINIMSFLKGYDVNKKLINYLFETDTATEKVQREILQLLELKKSNYSKYTQQEWNKKLSVLLEKLILECEVNQVKNNHIVCEKKVLINELYEFIQHKAIECFDARAFENEHRKVIPHIMTESLNLYEREFRLDFKAINNLSLLKINETLHNLQDYYFKNNAPGEREEVYNHIVQRQQALYGKTIEKYTKEKNK